VRDNDIDNKHRFVKLATNKKINDDGEPTLKQKSGSYL